MITQFGHCSQQLESHVAIDPRGAPGDCVRRCCLIVSSFLLAVAIGLWPADTLFAQKQPAAPVKPPEPPKPLIDRDPFDRLILDATNKNAEVEVQALPFRKLPPMRDGSLRVRLVKQPDKQYDVSWKSIDSIKFFEEILMEEGEKLLKAGNYNEAFMYLNYVYQNAPQTPGLDDTLNDFLFVNSGTYFKEKKYPQALSLLEELYRRNPSYKTKGTDISTAIAKLIDQIMTQYMAVPDYAGARNMVIRVTDTYGERQRESIDKWRGKISAIAEDRRDKARALMDVKNYRRALPLINEMLNIWPKVEGGSEISEEITRKYPMVVVGVTQAAAVHDSGRFDDWAARRTGRLVQRRLCEYAGRGPEGGRYESPLGTLETSDDGRQMLLLLDPTKIRAGAEGITGYDVAQRMLGMADPKNPTYLPSWGALVSSVTVQNVNLVRIDFRRSHVLPESLLQSLMPSGSAAAQTTGEGPFLVAEKSAEELHFLTNPKYQFSRPTTPVEIVEQLFEKPDKALQALKRGEVDMLDRVFPADAGRLKKDSALHVVQYALPTIHVLVPNYNKPWLARSTFRRALLYAIDRETILYRELLGGNALEGCQVISGPLPPGNGPNDSLAYGYDEFIKPRPYDFRMSIILVQAARKELSEIAKKKEEPEPILATLLLGHPGNEIARVSCLAIKEMVEMTGLKLELKELPADKLHDPEGTCDLVFAELGIWEPIVDATRMFGSRGYVPESSPYVGLTLRKLDAAKNWKDAGDALKQLHLNLFNDVSVLPLWQITEHFAYRKWLAGPKPQTVLLYQDVERWQLGSRRGSEE